jgi:hypothetical protein
LSLQAPNAKVAHKAPKTRQYFRSLIRRFPSAQGWIPA